MSNTRITDLPIVSAATPNDRLYIVTGFTGGTSGTSGQIAFSSFTASISGGTSGTSGSSGSSGTSGSSGSSGTSGSSGLEGNLAIWRFTGNTSTTTDPGPSYFSLNTGDDFSLTTTSIAINDTAYAPSASFQTILNSLTVDTIIKLVRVDDP